MFQKFKFIIIVIIHFTILFHSNNIAADEEGKDCPLTIKIRETLNQLETPQSFDLKSVNKLIDYFFESEKQEQARYQAETQPVDKCSYFPSKEGDFKLLYSFQGKLLAKASEDYRFIESYIRLDQSQTSNVEFGEAISEDFPMIMKRNPKGFLLYYRALKNKDDKTFQFGLEMAYDWDALELLRKKIGEVNDKSWEKEKTAVLAKIDKMLGKDKNVTQTTPTQSMAILEKGEYQLDSSHLPFGSVLTVKASSNLKSHKKINYSVKNLQDNDEKTAWVEGKADYGIGEYLEFKFDFLKVEKPDYHIESIKIINGYGKSKVIWKANSRVKKVTIFLNNELHTTAVFNDTMEVQYIGIPKIRFGGYKAFLIKVEIDEIYKGTKYKDTAISELSFVSTKYQKILNESKNLIELEKRLPDFPIVVFNDETLSENQIYDFIRQYSYRTDGEYSEVFSCDCFDYVEKVYIRQKKKVKDKEFLHFLLEKAIWCDFTAGIPRYEGREFSEFISIWKNIKNQIIVEDKKLTKKINDIINGFNN